MNGAPAHAGRTTNWRPVVSRSDGAIEHAAVQRAHLDQVVGYLPDGLSSYHPIVSIFYPGQEWEWHVRTTRASSSAGHDHGSISPLEWRVVQ